MRTVTYEIERLDEYDFYLIHQFECRHATTGDEYEYLGSIGPAFDSRAEARGWLDTFLNDI